jgi:hypothetical protein
MVRLNELRAEYEKITDDLRHPFTFQEYQQFRDRRKALLIEARELAVSLNVQEPHWCAQL